ncbi:MAG: Thiazole synthase [uncultured Thermomicrobiales bacterium]|uniref:Thiazole synthase n=1 Tax=uncultured Thermomicrobiales bacterium TaxID=1645740 RepID=A0A6J4UAU6_9BACT|nr:MAG: Thiazole synthase [uncultured Thermomicrobiales bacterium]
MNLTVNRQLLSVEKAELTILDFLRLRDLPETSIVVAVNGEIIPPSAWAEHTLKERDDVDIVRAVSGGDHVDVDEDGLEIAGVRFRSRLFVGTGKYPDPETMTGALRASGTEMVTVAIRYMDLSSASGSASGSVSNGGSQGVSILDQLDLAAYRLLPNTAGAYTVEDALKMARLARAVTGTNWIKLEVIGDQATLWPDVAATIEATRILVDEGFVVLPYTSPDLVAAKRLEAAGAATVMPLASPIGSGQGVQDWMGIQRIIDAVSVPVVVDAGIGVPSDAALAMEMGAAAVLVNTAIARAELPVTMATAMRLGTEAGRLAFRAGRIPKSATAHASSPTTGVPLASVSGSSERIE